MSADPFFVLRLGRPGDHALILETWTMLTSELPHARAHGSTYFAEQKALIRRILARPSTELRVAVDPEDDDAIFGYAVLGHVETPTPRVYFVFVKAHSRKLGVATALLSDVKQAPCVYTHRPAPHVERLLPSKPENWTYNYFRNFED